MPRPTDPGALVAQRNRLNRLAWLLDNSIRLPVLNYRIGYDALIGLVPVLGDLIGFVLSGYIVVEGARLGVGLWTLLRMSLNLLLEVTIGAIPLLGDVFDMTFKANARNVALLNDYLERPEQVVARSQWIIRAVLLLMILFIVGLFFLAVWLIRWVWQMAVV